MLYPIDVSYDLPSDIPSDVAEHRRYVKFSNYSISEVASLVAQDETKIDILVHSIANAPEIKSPLLKTSRAGYLAALGASAYSFVSMLQYFGPITVDGAALCLSYIAASSVIPGYGGGMSSAKAALESDVRVLAYEAGRQWNMRVNCISAGVLKSRAAAAIGMIDDMLLYSRQNSPLTDNVAAEDIADTALALLSPLTRAVTGATLFADNGYHVMGAPASHVSSY